MKSAPKKFKRLKKLCRQSTVRTWALVAVSVLAIAAASGGVQAFQNGQEQAGVPGFTSCGVIACSDGALGQGRMVGNHCAFSCPNTPY